MLETTQVQTCGCSFVQRFSINCLGGTVYLVAPYFRSNVVEVSGHRVRVTSLTTMAS